MRNSGGSALCVALLVAVTQLAFAEKSGSPLEAPPSDTTPVTVPTAREAFVPERVVIASTALAAAIQLGTVAEGFLYGQDYFSYVLLGTASAQNVPAILFGARGAVPGLGAQLALDGVYAANQLLFGEDAVSPVLANFAHKFSMFGTYAAYSDLRSRCENRVYANIPQYSFLDLVSAPVSPSAYRDWSVWGYVAGVALYAGVSLALSDQSNAVWTTGSAYIGDQAFPLWAGIPLMLLLQVPNFIMTGAGEESMYRGVYYEELSYRFGVWPAKVVDAAYFTLSHYPQQWDSLVNGDPSALAFSALISVLQTFWLQEIYDRVGLRASVAAHAATDILLFFCDWLVQGGASNSSGFSVNERDLTVRFGVPL